MVYDPPLHRTNILETDDGTQSSSIQGRAGHLEMRGEHDAVKMPGTVRHPFLILP